MASIFGHGLAAYTITKVIDRKNLRLLVLLAIFSTILPDGDVLAFKLHIPYAHPLGHRGLTHSILFAFLWAGFLAHWLGKTDKLVYFIVLFLSTASHGVFDAMTTGGRGVGFFIPFDNTRYFLPWRPIKVSPIGIEDFLSDWGLQVIWSEIKIITIPCLIVLLILRVSKKRRAVARN